MKKKRCIVPWNSSWVICKHRNKGCWRKKWFEEVNIYENKDGEGLIKHPGYCYNPNIQIEPLEEELFEI